MNRLRFTIRGLVYLLFTIGLGGATCGGSTAASTPQTPPAPASNLRFFIDDIDTYPAIPSCGIDSRYDVDRVTDSWRGTMLMNGWADRHAAWPIPSPSDWIEYHLLPWGNDYNAVDAAHLAVYAGHGGVPESTTFQNWDIEPPHQTLFFNREQVFPSYGESTCFAPISGARTNGGALGSGEGLTTSHAYFLSSCTMAFRLVDPYFVANNRVRQAFGFRFSPVLGPIAARAFKDMFDDTLSMPNWFGCGSFG